MANRNGPPLEILNNHIAALEAQEAIKTDSNEEGNEDQLMQGLGQITAPMEMQD